MFSARKILIWFDTTRSYFVVIRYFEWTQNIFL
jgi:hypothetical protein